MSKRKSLELGQLDGEGSSRSKKSHRKESSSSSTSGEWLCANTRVPLPGEALSFTLGKTRKSSKSTSSKKRDQGTSKRVSAPNTESSWLPFACTAAASALLASRDDSDDQPCTSVFFSMPRRRRTIKVSDLRRASLSSLGFSSKCSRFRKSSAVLDPDKLKWSSFPNTRRKSAVLEELESPLKSKWAARAVERTPSPEAQSSSMESVVRDSQQDVSHVELRIGQSGYVDADQCGTVQRIQGEKAESRTSDGKVDDEKQSLGSSVFNKLVNPMFLESSPDEVLSGPSPLRCIISTPAKSDASSEVPATQDVVTESDDEEHAPSERFYVDERSRLPSNFPSAEKHEPASESEEDSDSSDDDEEFSYKTVAKMNLTGVAREFADYLLMRQSERAIARRDPDVSTVTYEVVETVSAWGMSISCLSPKAIMYAPPFVRDPATVTLTVPFVTLRDESDPETPIILNPSIVATTQQVVVADSTEN